uniref:Reverse transcriptase domain-containing protein n=1 Tax=Angiostrongylus cantonensis TaxID=6313 RepID=A0A0K0CXR4_ANGCA
MVKAAKAGKSIRKSRRSFANYKTKMITLRRPDGTITASRKAIEKIIHEYDSDLFDILLRIKDKALGVHCEHWDGRTSENRWQLHHFRFADDIVLITPDISQVECLLVDFDKACGKIGLRLNLKKTMFMKNGLVSFAPFMLNGTNISECSCYVYLGREINMMNDLAPELSRRKRAAWGGFKSIGM